MKKIPLLLITAATAPARAGEYAATKFEDVPTREAAEIAELVDLTHKLLEQRYGAGTGETMARRAVHPKAHGCVKADFIVNAVLMPAGSVDGHVNWLTGVNVRACEDTP